MSAGNVEHGLFLFYHRNLKHILCRKEWNSVFCSKSCADLEDFVRLKRSFLTQNTNQCEDRIIITNIKMFSDGMEKIYKENVHNVISKYPLLHFFLSTEKKNEFKHDLVGLLNCVSRLLRAKNGALNLDSSLKDVVNSLLCASPIHFILDGGQKSRNYLLTLFFGYQGLYRMLNHTGWEIALETSILFSSQFPNSSDWVYVSSIDYDVAFSDMRVGNIPIKDVSGDVESIFLMNPRGDFEPDNDEVETARMMTKGIAVLDSDGKIIDFREKPSYEELLLLAKKGALAENIMIMGMRKSLFWNFFRLIDDLQSVVFETKKIRECYIFGFYFLTAATRFLPWEDWRSKWLSDNAGIASTYDSDGVVADGLRLFETCKEFFTRFDIYACTCGNSVINDMGEPKYYHNAYSWRCFSPLGRKLASLPSLEHRVVNSHIDKNIQFEVMGSCGNYLIYNSSIVGSGTLRFTFDRDYSCPNNLAGIVISNCHISLAKDEYLDIHLGLPRIDEKETNLQPSSHIFESCWIEGVCILIEGASSLIVGFDTHYHQKQEETTLSFRDGAIVATLNLGEGNCKTFFWNLNRSVKELNPRTGKDRLAEAIFNGRDFAGALNVLNASQLFKRHIELFSQIARDNSDMSSLVRLSRRKDSRIEYVTSIFDSLENISGFERDRCRNQLPFPKRAALPSESKLHSHEDIFANLKTIFTSEYGESPMVFSKAPGRLNDGAAHTDWSYHWGSGFAINRYIYVAMGFNPNSNGQAGSKDGDVIPGLQSKILVKMHSLGVPDDYSRYEIQIDLGAPLGETFISDVKYGWANYIVGMVHESLTRWKVQVDGISDICIAIESSLPQNRGLSSSAALENAVGTGLYALFRGTKGEELTDQQKIEIIRIGNHVENFHVGVGSGILDQGVSAFGIDGGNVVIDCGRGKESIAARYKLPLQEYGYTIVVVDTGTQRSLTQEIESNTNEFESKLSVFNRRVFRYWFGVRAIFSVLPICPGRNGQLDGSPRPFQLASKSNPSLIAHPLEMERALDICPESILIVYPNCFIEESRDQIISLLHKYLVLSESDFDLLETEEGLLSNFRDVVSSALEIDILSFKECTYDDLVAKKVTPVVVFKLDEICGLKIPIHSNLLGIGWTKVQKSNSGRERGENSSYLVSSRDPCEMVQFMVQEAFRVRILAHIHSKSEEGDDRRIPVDEDDLIYLRKVVTLHLLTSCHKSLMLIAHSTSMILSSLNLSCGAICNLSEEERILLHGILGDICWIDKRHLFKGDSSVETLQQAFDCLNELIKKNPENPHAVLGKFSPGAGFAGTCGVYMKNDNLLLKELEYLLNGRIYDGSDCHSIPSKYPGWIPYSSRDRLRMEAGMKKEDVKIWITTQSEGMSSQYVN